jgi:hypothetical protein
MDFDCDSYCLAPGQGDIFDRKKNGALKQRADKKVENFGTELNFSFWFFSSSNSCSSPVISVQHRV